VNQKYPFLLQTIQNLTPGNITSLTVADQLTNTVVNTPPNTPPGCVDLSLSLFNKAVNEGNPNSPLTQQQIYDFQDAADLLTNADPNTTCDSIVTNNARVFKETQGPPPVYNPSGQVRWRFGNISNATTMRILNLLPAATWPPPVSLSVSPQYMFAQSQCVATGCPAQQNPSTAMLSWALAKNVNSCTWTSNDQNHTLPNASSQSSFALGSFTTPGTYSYTLTCNVPPATVHSTSATLTTAPSGAGYTGGTLTAAWANSAAAGYQVTLSTGQIISPCTITNSTTLTCPSTNITGNPTATINVSYPTMSTYLTVWPRVTVTPSPLSVVVGSSAQVTWTPPTGATACTLANNGQGTWNAGSVTFVQGPATGTSYNASYLTSVHDVAKGVTFWATCTAGGSIGVNSITVTHH
jgi:hypothetical protein